MKSPLGELEVRSTVLAGHHLNFHRHGPLGYWIKETKIYNVECTLYTHRSLLTFCQSLHLLLQQNVYFLLQENQISAKEIDLHTTISGKK